MNKNVVIFFTDQQRFDSLGCNGNVDAITKNIVIHAKMNRFKVLAANSSPSFNLFQSLFQFDVAVVVIEFVSEETVFPCFVSFPSFGIDCLNDFREAEIGIRTVFI